MSAMHLSARPAVRPNEQIQPSERRSVSMLAEWVVAIVATAFGVRASEPAFAAAGVPAIWGVITVGLLAMATVAVLGWGRRQGARRAAASVRDQLEFVRALLLAEDPDEVHDLVQRNSERDESVRLPVDLTEPVLANLRKLSVAELRAATDSLTGLPNKQVVGDTLRQMFGQATRSGEPLAVLIVDLDNFKDINDRFGHQAGDRVLSRVGAALRSAVRSGDFAGRNGGEEFAVLLPGTDLAGAMRTAEKVRAAIARVRLFDVDVEVTASVGVAVYPTNVTRPDQLEYLADAALYAAKRSGRNQIAAAPAPLRVSVA